MNYSLNCANKKFSLIFITQIKNSYFSFAITILQYKNDEPARLKSNGHDSFCHLVEEKMQIRLYDSADFAKKSSRNTKTVALRTKYLDAIIQSKDG